MQNIVHVQPPLGRLNNLCIRTQSLRPWVVTWMANKSTSCSMGCQSGTGDNLSCWQSQQTLHSLLLLRRHVGAMLSWYVMDRCCPAAISEQTPAWQQPPSEQEDNEDKSKWVSCGYEPHERLQELRKGLWKSGLWPIGNLKASVDIYHKNHSEVKEEVGRCPSWHWK